MATDTKYDSQSGVPLASDANLTSPTGVSIQGSSIPLDPGTPISLNTTSESSEANEAARLNEQALNQQSISPDGVSVQAEAAFDPAPDIKPEDDINSIFKSRGPSYFEELDNPVYIHDVIVYIQGVDVSPWLKGSLSVKYNTNVDPNSCDFELDNTANRFVITPENIAGKWRRAGTTLHNDYDETAKHEIFKFKTNENYKPDDMSNGNLWNISYWSSIFHKNDPIRVWIKNPQQRKVGKSGKDADEWLPVFTGYIMSFPMETNHINDSSTIRIHAEDIRSLMRNMRVNQNNYHHLPPGAEAGFPTFGDGEGDLLKDHTEARSRFDKGPTDHYDNSIFADLILKDDNSLTQRVWDFAPFYAMVDILTFGSDDGVKVLNEASTKARADLEKALAAKEDEFRREQDPTRQAQLEQEINERRNTLSSNLSPISSGTTSADSAPSTTETPTGNNSRSGRGLVATHPITLKGQEKRSRLGRMQRGIFRGNDHFSVRYPDGRPAQQSFLAGWYSLCAFGTPHRNAKDGYLRFSTKGGRYWREAEVKRAGERTRYAGSWAPDTQAVHMMEPNVSATSQPFLNDVRLRDASNTIAYSRLFMSRLEMLDKACALIDYRFWVTGTGDLVFEFPNYDFRPSDYGAWAPVMTFDTQIISENLNEEAGKIPTVLVGTKHTTGIIGLGDRVDSTRNQLTTDNYEIVWAPMLVARLGVVSETVAFNNIVDSNRLAQLTTLTFQRKLGTFTNYTMSTIYRPWVQPNRPLYNKYRSRYALIDNVGFTLPVTAGSRAGNVSPTTELTLNYVRSIDITGVPRYITGGPSMPIFYGERQGENDMLAVIRKSLPEVDTFIGYITAQSTNLTAEGLRLARDEGGIFISRGHDIFNVLGGYEVNRLDEGFEGKLAIAASPIQGVTEATVELRKRLDELQSGLDNRMSEKELALAIADVEKTISALRSSIEDAALPARESDDSTAGKMPLYGLTGIRHVSLSLNPSKAGTTPRNTPGNTCNVGPYPFSCPLGTTQKALSFKGSVIQEAGQFPRSTLTTYGLKTKTESYIFDSIFDNLPAFAGVDFIADRGENVYSVAEGTVRLVLGSSKDELGTYIVINHPNGYETTYGAVHPSVRAGDNVARNQVIGTIGSSARSNIIGVPVLHFMTHTGVGNTISIPSYLVGNKGDKVNPASDDPENTYYPITADDILWTIRASVGEAGADSDSDAESLVIASAFINRYVSVNDASIRNTGNATWSSLQEFIKGNPPYGRGYSQPISEYWTTRTPFEDGKPHPAGGREQSDIDRREDIRSLGTPGHPPLPGSRTSKINDLFSGSIPVTPEVSHFRAPGEAAINKFLKDNKAAGAMSIDKGLPNKFFTTTSSRSLSARGLPKVTTATPAKLARIPYDPTRSGHGANPGVPNLKAILSNLLTYPSNKGTGYYQRYANWSHNKVLLVGSFAGRDLGKAVKKILESIGATVSVVPGLEDSIPGRTGKSTDLVSEARLALLRGALDNFKPDVTFIMYGATMVEANKLNSAMTEINGVVTEAKSTLWWVGPPEYPKGHNLAKYKIITDTEGNRVLGKAYVKSAGIKSTSTKASMTSVDGAAANSWAELILASGNTGGKNSSVEGLVSTIDDFWRGAVPPEKCPPINQPKAVASEPVLQSLPSESNQSIAPGIAIGGKIVN